MISNYLKIAFRSLIKRPVFSLINILGLSIGISASLVIFLIVQYDFSFDRFHPDGNKIYRVTSQFKQKEGSFYNGGVCIPLKDAVRDEVSGIETVAFFYEIGFGKAESLKPGNVSATTFKNPRHIIFADNNYFSLLNYEWTAGSPQQALTKPGSVVLTESRAAAYFSTSDYKNLIGRQVRYDDTLTVAVTGIIKDFKKPSDFIFKEFVSLKTIENNAVWKINLAWDAWNNTSSAAQLLIKVNNKENFKLVEKQLTSIAKKHQDPGDAAYGQTRLFPLQPLNDIHFNADYYNFSNRIANKKTLLGLSLIAGILLLLACINFINLSTAQAGNRVKEIGVRKTMGSSKGRLIVQFLGETTIVTTLACVLSILLIPLLFSAFTDFIPWELSANLKQQPNVLLFIAFLIPVVSVLAGFYPALVLSRLKPTAIFKNNGLQGNARAPLRKVLTVSQFIIAQVFIMATLMIGKQIHYLLNKDMGFRKESVITTESPWRGNSQEKKHRILQMLKAVPGIDKVSIGTLGPSSGGSMSRGLEFNNGKETLTTSVEVRYADARFLNVYQFKLLAGNNLSTDTAREYVINETYARILGFRDPQKAVGKFINDVKPIPIVGVIKDFNQSSLRETVRPLVISSRNEDCNTFHIALKPQLAGTDGWKKAIAATEKIWKDVYPEHLFEYQFVDESIAGFYNEEQRVSKLLTWASGLSGLISCMGLLGLAIYTVNLRTKEIGVRKVLGASVKQIVGLLSKDFVQLVLLAFLIAVPVSFYIMHRWLESYPYKTEINVWIFLLAGILMTAFALVTICFQTVKAALANPVKSLRAE